MELASAAITDQNQFATTDERVDGHFNISVYGSFSATVHVQRSFDQTTWLDVASYTTAGEHTGFEPEGAYYRVGVKVSNFGAGTVNVRIGGVPYGRGGD